MRVLVYGLVGTHRGGIETFLLKMNQNMSKDTVFDYVVEEESCLHTQEIESRGGKVYYIISRHSHPIKNIKDNKKLLKSLKETHDVVYFNLSSLSWIKPIKLAVKYGYRVFVHSHNAEFIKANGSLPYRILNKINKKALSRMNIERLTCSEPATKFMFENNNKVEMIYNAIDPNKFKFDIKTRESVRNELKLGDSFVIGFVGRLQYQKNPLFLVDIYRKTQELHKNVKMLIVGEGDLRESLEAKIKEFGLEKDVLLLGNRPNVNELLQAMDIFVLPSRHEGLPYVVVEAQTAGLKCLISEYVTREVDITGNVEYLSIETDASNWGQAINSFAANNDIEKREHFYQIVKESNFNINIEAKRLEKILNGDN